MVCSWKWQLSGCWPVYGVTYDGCYLLEPMSYGNFSGGRLVWMLLHYGWLEKYELLGTALGWCYGWHGIFLIGWQTGDSYGDATMAMTGGKEMNQSRKGV